LREGKEGVIAKIAQENNLSSKGFNIEEIAWVKKTLPWERQHHLGYGSTARKRRNGRSKMACSLGQDTYVGSVEAYKKKERLCYNCQALGHEAWCCKQRKRYGHCPAEHDRRDCPPGSAAHCVDCDGNHQTGAKECLQRRITSSPAIMERLRVLQLNISRSRREWKP
jgi:hypothetical protein